MPECVKCQHEKPEHRDDICYGERFCTCIKFEEVVTNEGILTIIPLGYARPLPQPITTHDNWKGNGWEYQKKWGKTQQEMVEFLHYECHLVEGEIRQFLRCKSASVRGRLSEINAKRRMRIGL